MTTITFKQTEWHIQHAPDQPRTTLPPLPETSSWPHPKPVPCSAKQANNGKCIITVKNPLPAQPVNADYQMTTFHDRNDFWNIDLEEMLIRLGQKVIQGDQRDEWLSMVQVASLCRRYRLKLQEAHSASGGSRGKWPHRQPAATAEPDLAVQGFTGIEPRCEECRLWLPAGSGQRAVCGTEDVPLFLPRCSAGLGCRARRCDSVTMRRR